MTSILMILYQKMILTLKRDKEAAMVTLYKVTYMVQADESGIIYTTTTTWEELDRMLDDPEIIVFGYIKQEVII